MNTQVIAADNAGLRAEDLAAMRENLHEQRLFRREQLGHLSAPSQSRADHVRWRQAASQIEVHVELAAFARMALADVEAALDRMARGHYGFCHLCVEPIAVDRLKIVPQARYCARCHRLRESGL